MKSKSVFVILSGLCALLFACKKQGAKPESSQASTTPITTSQMLVGEWLIVKDSVQTFDYRTPVSNVKNLVPSGNDFVTFDQDNSGNVSSLLAFDILYTDYGRLYINPEGPADVPNYNFKYAIASPVTALPPTLSIPNITATAGVTYSITSLTTTRMILHYDMNITKYPHDYVIKEDIYLSKQ